MAIPTALLKRFYVKGSLHNSEDGFEFRLKNTIAPATVVSFGPIEVDGEPFGPDQVVITASRPRTANTITAKAPLPLHMGKTVTLRVLGPPLTPGSHEIAVHAVTREVGPVIIEIDDSVAPETGS
ncbi:MAG: hypothetical protein GXP42_09865 [Chloroflexi bacterium]|nr:hypothetical protein [Chloroflexota bacterium]